MVKDLVKDEKTLSTECDVATEADAQIAEDLLDTFDSLEEVACLAANQIGQTKAIGVFVDDGGEPKLIFNPTLKRALYPIKAQEECFTKDEISKVTRYGKIRVEYEELKDGKLSKRQREYSGDTAQAIQHLIDHCKGKYV